MKKILFAALLLASVMPAAAQETYENVKVAAEDLNGSARYVGMGGAMEALGAELSTMKSNPAGIGLFRRSNATVSFGAVIQGDAPSMSGADKTHMSFDQAGVVISTNTSGRKQSFVNIGFNYHKSRNFDYILSASNSLSGASQNKLTYVKAKNDLLFEFDEYGNAYWDTPYITCNQLDYLYADNLNCDRDGNWHYYEATDYSLQREHTGYVGEYDFNISGNIDNRIYLGLTIGYHDVNYKHRAEYTENVGGGVGKLLVSDNRTITGDGADVSAGVIVRPLEYSPFRIGLSVSTPTFYRLTTDNKTSITDGRETAYSGENYEFKLYTPWKFGLSLGHTIGTQIALGASYEYADYGSLDSRYISDDRYYDYYDNTRSDDEMNLHTESTLKGVSTLKLGAEFKPTDQLALRVGYNYVSPTYREDGFKDGTIYSEGSYYSSATDFTNWKSTNRVTAGVGLTLGQFALSAAYQLSMTKGDFYPFMGYVDNDTPEDCIYVNPVTVKNNRHQLLFSIGYTF